MPRILIKKDEIEEMAGLQKTHFVNPNARRLNKSLGDAAGLTGIGFHLVEVQPGDEASEHHRHHHEDECVYILSGHATAMIDDQEYQIGPGDFLGYARGGPAHSIRNTGTEVLRFLVAGARAAHDVADYPRLGKRLFRNQGMPWQMVSMDDIQTPDASAGKK